MDVYVKTHFKSVRCFHLLYSAVTNFQASYLGFDEEEAVLTIIPFWSAANEENKPHSVDWGMYQLDILILYVTRY